MKLDICGLLLKILINVPLMLCIMIHGIGSMLIRMIQNTPNLINTQNIYFYETNFFSKLLRNRENIF